MKISDLKVSEYSNRIYNHTAPDDLVESIKNNGVLQPIWVSPEGVIISGHRRVNACQRLGINDIPVEIRKYSDLLVIEANRYREKTWTEKLKEAEELEKILRPKAREKQSEGGGAVPQKSDKARIDILKETAKVINTSHDTLHKAKVIARENPKLLKDVDRGRQSIHAAYKKVIKEKKRKEVQQEFINKASQILPASLFSCEVGDINTYQIDRQFDFIITDPPYPKEYLPLYSVLSKRAGEWLKPEGMLIVMCGQSYLNEIYIALSAHLTYYWTGCYLTPGQPTPLRDRQVNTTWKPILFFVKDKNYTGKIFGDVFKSDGNDKDYHEWGQSVSGMYSLISQIARPGQSIFDPFCGAGTTGVAAIKHQCQFYGIDIEEKNILISRGRMNDEAKK